MNNHPSTGMTQAAKPAPVNSASVLRDSVERFPKPADCNNNKGTASYSAAAMMDTDQLLGLMTQVSVLIKAGDFNSKLGADIIHLCHQLKFRGQHLEQVYEIELNRVFVSLRQAACRDSGQLGTPCRLKIMELVELQAMGWRSNLAHTQYYLKRTEQSSTPAQPTAKSPDSFNPSPPSVCALAAASSNNFSVPPPSLSQPQLFTLQGITNNSAAIQPGYFIIPATGIIMIQAANARPFQPSIAVPFVTPSNVEWPKTRGPAGSEWTPGTNSRNTHFETTRLPAANSKSSKAQQFQEGMTIRNSDSGKIMGVKGRRVALVEQLTNTIISFQKVGPKSKERILTLTSTSEESIQTAKRLIEETIKRNVSPNPVEDCHIQPILYGLIPRRSLRFY